MCIAADIMKCFPIYFNNLLTEMTLFWLIIYFIDIVLVVYVPLDSPNSLGNHSKFTNFYVHDMRTFRT